MSINWDPPDTVEEVKRGMGDRARGRKEPLPPSLDIQIERKLFMVPKGC